MKKKITRILTATMLAVMMVFTAIPFASAATNNNALDETKKVSFTLNCSKPGYTFTVYKVAELKTTENPYKTGYDSLIPSISDEILSGKTSNVLSALDGLSSIPSTASTVGTFTTSATSVKKTFSSLAQGLYYIKATNFPAGVRSVTNSVVSLPYYNNGWVYSINDIDLATKVNDGDVVTGKTITNSTKDNVNFTDVSLGDTVNFEIKSSTAGSSEMKLKSYTVYDEMSAGLTLDKDSVKVALLNAQGGKVADLASTDYALNVTSEVDGKATTFNVALTNAYLQKKDFYAEGVTYTSVTYSAKLNKYAVAGKTGNPNTETKLVYSNKNGVESEVNGNTVYVYTFAVTVYKTDTSGNPLEGAGFDLFVSEEDGNTLTNEIATGVSDKTGKVTFYNSNKEEIKLASGKYYIVETKAPTGYNIYGKVIPVTIDVTYGATFVDGSYITNCPTDGTASVDVKDTKVVVPQTGGVGTVMFYILDNMKSPDGRKENFVKGIQEYRMMSMRTTSEKFDTTQNKLDSALKAYSQTHYMSEKLKLQKQINKLTTKKEKLMRKLKALDEWSAKFDAVKAMPDTEADNIINKSCQNIVDEFTTNPQALKKQADTIVSSTAKVIFEENYLKNAEMSIEDDYDSIDGIINNGNKQQEYEKLKEPEKKSERRTAPLSRNQIKQNANTIAHNEQQTNDKTKTQGQEL